MFRRKNRIILSLCIFVSMLLAGIHADQNILSAYAYTDAGSLAPSIDYRIHYAAHHDIATAKLLYGESASYKIEARRIHTSGQSSYHSLTFWQTWIPVLLSGHPKRNAAAPPHPVSSMDTIIRYIHDQDGEKDSFLQ